jgi:hypothetical protein
MGSRSPTWTGVYALGCAIVGGWQLGEDHWIVGAILVAVSFVMLTSWWFWDQR